MSDLLETIRAIEASCDKIILIKNYEIEKLEMKLAKVRELHKSFPKREACVECSSMFFFVPSPCPTIRALDGDE